MSSVIPPAFSFQFALPVRRADKLPKRGKRLLSLNADFELFWPGSEPGKTKSPIRLFAAWNAGGLGIAAEVTGKKHPAVSHVDRPAETDAIQIWLHTRSARTIHRANRLCHHFCLLPNGAGDDGLDPIVRHLPIGRAAEDPPIRPPEEFRIWSERRKDGYALEAWLPTECLNGFDPEESPQLGFYAMLKDSELGDHCLTVDSAFPFATDPSLWQTIDLIGD